MKSIRSPEKHTILEDSELNVMREHSCYDISLILTPPYRILLREIYWWYRSRYHRVTYRRSLYHSTACSAYFHSHDGPRYCELLQRDRDAEDVVDRRYQRRDRLVARTLRDLDEVRQGDRHAGTVAAGGLHTRTHQRDHDRGGVGGIDIVPPDVGVPVNCAGCVPPAATAVTAWANQSCSAVNSITLDIR